MKGCTSSFLPKSNLGISKNNRGITFATIAAKVYNTLLLNCIWPKVKKIPKKNQNGFQRNQSSTSQILTIHQTIEGVCAKILKATLLFVDFSIAFDSIHKGKMELIWLAYGLSNKTVAAIVILYKNMKAMVHSPDGDNNFFDIVTWVLQEDTLVP